MSKPNEMENLLEVLNLITGLDIKRKVRKREYVNARMVFIYILRSKGYPYTHIGDFLGINHATVIHSQRKAEWFVKTETDIRELFKICDDMHQKTYYGDRQLAMDEIISSLYKKDEEIEQLSLRIQRLESELKRKIKHESRLEEMFIVLQNKVPLGREKELTIKFNRLINGL